MLGFVVDGRSLICEVGPGTMEQDVIVGVRMRVRFRIVEGLGGPILEHSLQTSLPGGVLGRVLSFFLRPRLRAMQRVTLRNLVRV